MSRNVEWPALLGGVPVRDRPYPVFNPFGEREREAALSVIDSGMLSGFLGRGTSPEFLGGPQVRAFEDAFARLFQVPYAVSVNSATSGLHAALAAAGVGPGDEVVVPPYTMSATAAAVALCGATPVFADIEADTFCLDPAAVAAALGPRTRAVLCVNLFGLPSDLHTLRSLCNDHDALLIEDNAQAPLARCGGSLAGTVGHLGVFSLNRHKTMQVGEGGVVVTADDRLADRLRLVRNHGEVVIHDRGSQTHADIIGCNYRLTELQAALALPQLEQLETWNAGRVAQAALLDDLLRDFPFLQPPVVRPGCTHVYYLYAMRYDPELLGIHRDTLVSALKAEGVHAASYHVPLYELPLFAGRDGAGARRGREACPVVEYTERESIVVSKLVQQPNGESEVDELARALTRIAAHAPELRRWQEKQSNETEARRA